MSRDEDDYNMTCFPDRFPVPVEISASNSSKRQAHHICSNKSSCDFDALKDDIAINHTPERTKKRQRYPLVYSRKRHNA